MQFGLLGPLVLADATGRSVKVAGARLRVLLAALLLHANTPVSTDVLAEAVWDGAPPAAAVRTLRSHIARLRGVLGPEAERLTAREPGYLIRVEPAELDVAAFEELCRDTSGALRAGEWAGAADTAARALRLWRGAPLLDVPSQQLHDRVMPRLEHLRLQALEDGAQAGLHLGDHERLVPQLRDLTACHPLRERFHAQLMLALARAGRQAEALAVYQNARRVLIDQLGIEPGPELRDLHQGILAGDNIPARPASTPGPSGPRAAPRQLPAAIRHFAGRARELKALSGLSQDGQGGGTVVIGGTAGVGKTALAVHWAHRHANRFPDGQLYVNLRGFDPSGTPVSSADAVRRFLDVLGVPAQRIPADPDEQTALYRSQLAAKRMLILLDNAREAGQVRPLLPSSPGCLVLVTSRSQLADLVALDGAIPVALDLLTRQEALDLLTRRLGSERLAAEGQAADDLIQACARLPLALNIAAAHFALHPARPLSQFANGLHDARQRLNALTIGSGGADIRAVFSWSYRALDPQTARVFRLLGMHPGPDISVEAAASLAALDLDRTRHCLQALSHAHLIIEHATGRYTFHDLLRAYAAEQAHTHDTGADREEAVRRVCDFYLHTAHAADFLLNPHRKIVTLGPPAPGSQVYPLTDRPAAMTWFDTEHANLLAAQRAAVARRWYTSVWQLAWAVDTFHYQRGRLCDQLEAWQAALEAAERLSEPAVRVRAYCGISHVYIAMGRCGEAVEHLSQALTLGEQLNDLSSQFSVHRQLAWACEQQGDYRQALHHVTRVLDLQRSLGQPVWEADALNAVGWFTARLGDYSAGRAHCQAALALHRRQQNPDGQAEDLDSLGYIEHQTGHHRQAIDYYQQALALRRSVGSINQAVGVLERLGHVHAALGQYEHARAIWRQALELYRQHERPEGAERLQRQLDGLGQVGSRLAATASGPGYAVIRRRAAPRTADDRRATAARAAHRPAGAGHPSAAPR